MQTEQAIERSIATGALDVMERAIALILFIPLCWQLLLAYLETGQWSFLTLLASEGLIVAFLIIRRITEQVSMRPLDWMLALGGTALPLLARPDPGPALVPQAVGLTLMWSGFVLQISAKLSLRRSFGLVPANRGVKGSGPYAVIRHPMYAGYALTQVGFLLLNPSAWNCAVYATAFGVQIIRLLAEEHLLSHDPAYRALAASVRYRLVPGVF
jgi:protein-S-isoprenylcysteine O-methyltransferase Ste14